MVRPTVRAEPTISAAMVQQFLGRAVRLPSVVVEPEGWDELYLAHLAERARRIEGHAGRVESVDEEPRS